MIELNIITLVIEMKSRVFQIETQPFLLQIENQPLMFVNVIQFLLMIVIEVQSLSNLQDQPLQLMLLGHMYLLP